MPREFSRSTRVSQSIKRAMASIVSDWVRENKIGMASVTAADVSPDMKRSRVYVSIYDCDDKAAAITALNLQAGRFRHALSGQVRLRNIPALEIILDESIERGDSMSRTLESLRPEEQDD